MHNNLDDQAWERLNQEMIKEAIRVMHQILRNAQDGDKKAISAIKENRKFFLRMQKDYEEFKHYKI